MKQTVLIMTDTQRTDMVGCYGTGAARAEGGLRTPNIDALAARGVRFNRAYTCQPVCGPARSALFTGVFPHSNGSWTNSMALGDNVKTIGQRLRDQGYRTAYIGKWHLDGGDYFGLGRCPDGWDKDYWYDMKRYLDELSPEDRRRSRDPKVMEGKGVDEGFTFGHRVSDRALDFLGKHGNEDFLLVVSYDEPHHPFVCPEPYASMYKNFELPASPNVYDHLSDKPPHYRAWAGEAAKAIPVDSSSVAAPGNAAAGAAHATGAAGTAHAAGAVAAGSSAPARGIGHPYFFGCNSFVDYEIGRVLAAIEQHAPGAQIIYTSDHGDALGSHGLSAKGPSACDEIARIPFIIRNPQCAAAPSVCEDPVSHIDIMPTILDHFGVPIPKLVDGRSLLPCLRDRNVRVNGEVFIEFGRYEVDHDGFGGFQPMRAVFDGRYKLSIHLLSSDELYDLESDPAELVNLIEAPRYARIRDSLHDRLLEWMNRSRDPFRGYYWERRPWRTDARPATWDYTAMTRQRENEEYESRQLDYSTGLPMEQAVRKK